MVLEFWETALEMGYKLQLVWILKINVSIKRIFCIFYFLAYLLKI